MKDMIKYLSFQRSMLTLVTISLFFFYTLKANAQEEDASSKLPVSINLNYKISDGIKSVKVSVSRKENRKFIPVDNVIVNLYLNEIKKHDETTGEGWISNLNTNEDGKGTFIFPAQFDELTEELHEFTFIATMNSAPRYEDTEEEITIKDVLIKIAFHEEDSIKTITAKLTEWSDSISETPVPETEMKLCIKRTFSLLPFGEEGLETDDNGEVSGEIPSDVPGNANGIITVVAKIEDHETYGTVEVSKNIPWNLLPKENTVDDRTLWSSGNNAPIPLVFASVSIIVLIWGTLVYLVYLLLKIRGLSKK